MDEYYGMFCTIRMADPVIMQEAWSITKECAMTGLNLV